MLLIADFESIFHHPLNMIDVHGTAFEIVGPGKVPEFL